MVERLASRSLLLRLAAHGAEAEQRTTALEREGEAFQEGQCLLERGERAVGVAFRGLEEAAAAGGGCGDPPASETPRLRLVRLQVRTGALQLPETDQRLDRVGPDGGRRIVESAREHPFRQLTQAGGGSLQVSERELETAAHSEGQDDVDLFSERRRGVEPHLDGRTCLVDEAEVHLEHRLDAADERAPVGVLRLLGDLESGRDELERLRPAAGEPLDDRQTPEDVPACDLVASGGRLRFQLAEDGAAASSSPDG